MIQPSIDSLLGKVDCKYSLVVVAAKRARAIVDGSEPMEKSTSSKPVSIALSEIGAEKVFYEKTKEGIK